MAVVTLTTDFGEADGYVGVMRGVILSIAPQARLVDLSHQIPPQDVFRAAMLLYNAVPFFPPGTIHLAVVDPGVGTKRRAIALQTSRGFYVGPDNGLFTLVLSEESEWTAVELPSPDPPLSHTFHGRDIFAPAAARLAAGVPLEELGPPVRDPVRLPLPMLDVAPGSVGGVMLYPDRFGNIVTSIGRLHWEGDDLLLTPAFRPEPGPPVRIPALRARVELAAYILSPIHRTYGEVEVGELLALVGSSGFLELAIRQGSAAKALDVRPADRPRLWIMWK